MDFLPNLNDLTIKQLQLASDRINARIEELKKKQQTKALCEIESIAEENELDPKIIAAHLKGRGATRKPRKLPVKYADPDDPEQVWSGRGKQPNWLKEKLRTGKKLEDYRVTPPKQ